MLKVYDYDIHIDITDPINETLQFSITDPNGTIRKALDGYVLQDGDTVVNSLSDLQFNDYNISSKFIYSVNIVGNDYTLKEVVFSGNRWDFEQYNKNGTFIEGLGQYSYERLYNHKEGRLLIPDAPLSELENFTFDISEASYGGSAGCLYLCVSDIDPNALEDPNADFYNRTGINDIFLFGNARSRNLKFDDGTHAPYPIAYKNGPGGEGVHPSIVDFIPRAPTEGTIVQIIINMTYFNNWYVGREIIIRNQTIPSQTGTYNYVNYDNYVDIHPAIDVDRFVPTDDPVDDGLLAPDDYRNHSTYTGDRSRNQLTIDYMYIPNSYKPSDPKFAGLTYCIVDKELSSFGFETGVDGDYNDFYGIQSDPVMNIEVIGETGTYYVDISDGVSQGGGTLTSPYNYQQFNDELKNITDGVEFYVKGHRSVSDLLFVEHIGPDTTPTSPINIIIRGWDIEINGSPIVYWDNDDDDSYNSFSEITVDNVNITIMDFILISINTMYSVMFGYRGPSYTNSIIFKNILFTVYEFNVLDIYNTELYGCTINSHIYVDGDNYSNLSIYDSVLYLFGESIWIGDINKLTMANNITNYIDFDNSLYNINDLTEYYSPTYNDNISYPIVVDSFDTLVGLYTSDIFLYYGKYVPYNNPPVVQNFRIDNDYNHGLLGNTRVSYGAYSFKDVSVDEELEDFPTSGHIGSFYFGGDYQNCVGNITDIPTLTISPNVNFTVDATIYIHDSIINIDIPSNKKFAIGNKNFSIDFVAKKHTDDTFPKFCDGGIDCDNTICDSKDTQKYDNVIVGGNPLIVDFSACAKSLLQFSDYKPVEYRWWFDYDTNSDPNDYISCAGPSATYEYCGSYLDLYNVRLCVVFEK